MTPALLLALAVSVDAARHEDLSDLGMFTEVSACILRQIEHSLQVRLSYKSHRRPSHYPKIENKDNVVYSEGTYDPTTVLEGDSGAYHVQAVVYADIDEQGERDHHAVHVYLTTHELKNHPERAFHMRDQDIEIRLVSLHKSGTLGFARQDGRNLELTTAVRFHEHDPAAGTSQGTGIAILVKSPGVPDREARADFWGPESSFQFSPEFYRTPTDEHRLLHGRVHSCTMGG